MKSRHNKGRRPYILTLTVIERAPLVAEHQKLTHSDLERRADCIDCNAGKLKGINNYDQAKTNFGVTFLSCGALARSHIPSDEGNLRTYKTLDYFPLTILNTMRYLYILTVLLLQPAAALAQFEGYQGYAYATEKSDVASSETGVVAKLLVSEGDFVKAGQPLVQLDSDTFQLQLESAKHDAENRTEIEAVEKRLKIQERSLEKLEQLLLTGNARQSEVERETMELDALRSSYQQKLYELKSREIQLARAQAMLSKRTITAPFDGQVAKIHRQIGEFVSPNTPEVVTLVNTRDLVAEFQVPISEIKSYQINQQVNLRVGSDKIVGKVKATGILVDKASQTVTVKVEIDNSQKVYQTGVDCVLITPY